MRSLLLQGRSAFGEILLPSNAVTAVTPQSMRNADVEMSWCLAALQVGDPFVLNCLGEAKYGVLMKVSV